MGFYDEYRRARNAPARHPMPQLKRFAARFAKYFWQSLSQICNTACEGSAIACSARSSARNFKEKLQRSKIRSGEIPTNQN